MDDGAGLAVLHRGFDCGGVGDIAFVPMHFFQVSWRHQQFRTTGISFQIESAHGHTGMGEQRQHPAANATSRASDQHGTVKL